LIEAKEELMESREENRKLERVLKVLSEVADSGEVEQVFSDSQEEEQELLRSCLLDYQSKHK